MTASETLPSRSAPELDDIDALMARVSKLQAMLAMTYGQAGESFRSMNRTLQDNYLWACADLAHESEGLLRQMFKAPRAAR